MSTTEHLPALRPGYAAPTTLAEIQSLGKIMVASGFFKDIRTEAQAVVKIIAGAARGYDPFTAMNAYHIIEGKLTETAGEIAARIKRSGRYDYRIKRLDNEACFIAFLQHQDGAWEVVGESKFDLDDATAAGLAGRHNWKTYARNMLFARALTNGARWYCADVFGGAVYTPEELGADVEIDASGEQRVVLAAGDENLAPPLPPRTNGEPGAKTAALREQLARKNVAVDDGAGTHAEPPGSTDAAPVTATSAAHRKMTPQQKAAINGMRDRFSDDEKAKMLAACGITTLGKDTPFQAAADLIALMESSLRAQERGDVEGDEPPEDEIPFA